MNLNQLSLILLILVLNLSAGCQFAATAKDDSSREGGINKSKNETALLQAQANIEKFRKGEAQIKISGIKSKTAKQIQLKIKQSSHDFKFGCYLKIDDLPPEKLPGYEKHFAGLFNYAVVGTYWSFVENKRGIEDWSWFEREIALSRKLGARIAAAPILWGTNQAGTPSWLPRQKDELLPMLKKRVQELAAKHADTIEDWEIVNEPLAQKPDVFANRTGRDYVESAFSWAREAAPAERLMLNEYGVFGSVARHNRNRDRYFALLEELIEKETAIDVIGIQAHANGEWYEPANVAEQLDRYAALGKPIQITEFSAQTLNYNDRKTPLTISGNYQSGVWNAENQARFYREFYTIAFGSPQVEAIVTWGLDDERAWLPGIGLIDEEGNPKPNYKALDQLINKEWRTNLQVNLTADNTAKISGFFGSYEVEAVVNGKTVSTTKFELKKGDKNEWILNL
jgi:GH35 family endo-1,4-beta-xylanase